MSEKMHDVFKGTIAGYVTHTKKNKKPRNLLSNILIASFGWDLKQDRTL